MSDAAKKGPDRAVENLVDGLKDGEVSTRAHDAKQSFGGRHPHPPIHQTSDETRRGLDSSHTKVFLKQVR